jgi:two-component system, NtrC family, sensor kinase
MKKLLIFIFVGVLSAHAQQAIKITQPDSKTSIGRWVYVLEDSENKLSINDVLNSEEFEKSEIEVPNFGVTNSDFWIKFTLTNTGIEKSLYLELAQPIMDEIHFYDLEAGTDPVIEGEIHPFSQRKYGLTNFVFDLNLKPGTTKTYFLKIHSTEQIQAPLYVGTMKAITDSNALSLVISSVFFGIMLVMILYNIFIYLSVKDKSYLYYVVYITILMLTQLTPKGFTYQYLWPNSPWLAKYSMFLFPALVGVAGIVFFNHFLETKKYAPKLRKIFSLLIVVYAIAILLVFTGEHKTGYGIIELTAMAVALAMLFGAIYISRKGSRSAKFFLVAWSVFLIGIVLWVLKDVGVLPYNNFTNYTMQFGAAIETILLSFGLADRINILRGEKEVAQKEALDALMEKERLIKEQNILLEQKVKDRTEQLEKSNSELNITLETLKETQYNLVQSEKMASLGQLTAGVAHEINNPINFVSSNIIPLRRDLDDIKNLMVAYESITPENAIQKLDEIAVLKSDIDYEYLKEELKTIVDGIEEGAKRTAAIVKSLKTFSAHDQEETIDFDINEGIKTTLTLLNNRLSGKKLHLELCDTAKTNCYSGQINQALMNLFSNALDAVELRWGSTEGGGLSIKSTNENNRIIIQVEDNGSGISDEIKNRIFDPFFTTKPVGQGTGLGLSITYKIIETHGGNISFVSAPEKGSTFTVSLPVK